MERKIVWADFVLIVGSEAYKRRYDGEEPPGIGRGAIWEATLTRVDLYEAQGVNRKFIPVLFNGSPAELLPKPLREHDYYRLPGDYEKLLRRLTGQRAVIIPPVGAATALPPEA